MSGNPMPIYEYQCKQCNKIVEELLPIGASSSYKSWCNDCKCNMDKIVSACYGVVIASKTPCYQKPIKKKDSD